MVHSSGAIEGGTALNLGGPKYAEFEIEPGRPFPSQVEPPDRYARRP
jgi:hypothetical protein